MSPLDDELAYTIRLLLDGHYFQRVNAIAQTSDIQGLVSEKACHQYVALRALHANVVGIERWVDVGQHQLSAIVLQPFQIALPWLLAL